MIVFTVATVYISDQPLHQFGLREGVDRLRGISNSFDMSSISVSAQDRVDQRFRRSIRVNGPN